MGSCCSCLEGITHSQGIDAQRGTGALPSAPGASFSKTRCRAAPAWSKAGWPCLKVPMCAGDATPAHNYVGTISSCASSSASAGNDVETDFTRIQSLIDNVDRDRHSPGQLEDLAWQEEGVEDDEFEPEDEGLHLVWTEDRPAGYDRIRHDEAWTPTSAKLRVSVTGEIMCTPPLPVEKRMMESIRRKGQNEDERSGALRRYLREVPTPLSRSPHVPTGDLGNFLKVTAQAPTIAQGSRDVGCFSGCCSATSHDIYDAEMRSRASDETAWVPRGQRLDIVWRVVVKSTWIRKNLELDSDRIFPLAEGAEVMATAVVGAELRIVSPANGWVSLVSASGEPLLLMARQQMECAETYPVVDVSGTFFAATLRDDATTAAVIAADLVRCKTAEPRHAIAAQHMVADGRKVWGEISELLDQHLWGMPEGPNASLIQHAILHGHVHTIRNLLEPNLEHELLASLSTLPARHIAMVEELFALASRRSASSARPPPLCTCGMLTCAKCGANIWEQLLRWTSARSWGRYETERRLYALRSPECLSFVLHLPDHQEISGVYEYVGEREWRPAYQLKTVVPKDEGLFCFDDPGPTHQADEGRLIDSLTTVVGAFVIRWHPSGQWCLREETSARPIFFADGGWLPPLEGWRLQANQSLECADRSIAFDIEDRFACENEIHVACSRGDVDAVTKLVLESPPLAQSLVVAVEDRLRSEFNEGRVPKWCRALQSCGVLPERITKLIEERRYLRFPRLAAKSGWQLLALARLQTLGQSASTSGQLVDLLTGNMDTAPNLLDACLCFDNCGRACVSHRDLQPLRDSLARLIAGRIRGVSCDSELVPVPTMLDLLAQDLWGDHADNDHALRQAFKALDTHKCGSLSANDLKHGTAISHSSLVEYGLGELCVVFTDAEVSDMMEEADMDGDGRVSYHEFARVIWAVTPK